MFSKLCRFGGKNKVLKTLLVIAIGFLPSLFSLWLMRKNKARTRTLLQRAAVTSFPRYPRSQNSTIDHRVQHNCTQSDRYYLQGVGYLVGDISCEYNARSGYLRCAVNPTGPCDGCRFYQERKEVSLTKHHFSNFTPFLTRPEDSCSGSH
ncbi:MAG: hypothetical protein HC836_06880 [Richelia sp. RM2_1_2]|nr:hypothetical protein [Richelia sp. SM1_7_0]NJN06944.1 hypothetical protein [Richelia sp. RM1_1_1]NJO26219.1 hypothetical protein [Richelia sp. SL_2_1]NJO58083.1 hypothetical protein [Richelia sp. RM2_1_2]